MISFDLKRDRKTVSVTFRKDNFIEHCPSTQDQISIFKSQQHGYVMTIVFWIWIWANIKEVLSNYNVLAEQEVFIFVDSLYTSKI